MMTPLEELLEVAASRSLTEAALEELAARHSRGGDIILLLIDFAPFVCRQFLSGAVDFGTANAALNQIMPIVGFEEAPRAFWEAYVAFEDFEVSQSPDEEARPRIQEILASLEAAKRSLLS